MMYIKTGPSAKHLITEDAREYLNRVHLMMQITNDIEHSSFCGHAVKQCTVYNRDGVGSFYLHCVLKDDYKTREGKIEITRWIDHLYFLRMRHYAYHLTFMTGFKFNEDSQRILMASVIYNRVLHMVPKKMTTAAIRLANERYILQEVKDNPSWRDDDYIAVKSYMEGLTNIDNMVESRDRD